MLLYRLGPEGFFAVSRPDGSVRMLHGDPFEGEPDSWRLGRQVEPGDVVLTGTPAGVGALADGDRLEVEIAGVGTLENPVESWRRC